VIKSRRRKRTGYIACMGERKEVYKILVSKPEGKISLGRTRHRWEDNIKMDIQEVGLKAWNGSSWLRIGTSGGKV
jgi:hypothetical protein